MNEEKEKQQVQEQEQKQKNNKRVLLVTQQYGYNPAEKAHCGVGVAGNLLAITLSPQTTTEEAKEKDVDFDFEVLYANANPVLEAKIKVFQPRVILYNFHPMTCAWMFDPSLRNRYPDIVHIMIHYDMTQVKIQRFQPALYHGFKYVISDDDTLTASDRVFITNRILPPIFPSPSLPVPVAPVIGFQGFGPPHKGIARIAHKVQEEFDTAIIRLHIPYSLFGDPDGRQARARVEEVKRIIRKPGIKVVSTHTFMTVEETVAWLHQNTINCYFYDYLDGAGIASAPNFALAARKPIAVTRSFQLRNFWNLKPSVCIEDRSLKEIIASGLEPLQELYNKYTPNNVRHDYNRILQKFFC